MFKQSSAQAEKPILSVSELNAFARGTLEMHVGKIKVTGEISNFTRPASGHWYFTLKDQGAQIRCAMFRGRNQLIRKAISNGMQVIVHGNVSLYEPRGDYQLIADYIEEAGLGNLQQRFEKLKQQLAKEGLFAPQVKKPIPKKLRHIAVITSATGAAVQDIIKVFKQRYPLLHITVIPAMVQGETAAASLCQALQLAQRWNQEQQNNLIDAIIIGRGGGSIEDLWAFNEEILARAIFACNIPVVSAVGHETDTTIADFVADLRAPTPSAAAEMLSPDKQEISQKLDYSEQQLQQRILQLIKQKQSLINSAQLALKHPKQQLQQWQRQFILLQQQLHKSFQQQLGNKQHQVALFDQRLQPEQLKQNIAELNKRHDQLKQQLISAMQRQLKTAELAWQNKAELLNSVSPLRVQQRGYSISRSKNGEIIRSIKHVSVGDTLVSDIADGIISSQIITIEKK